MISPHWGQNNTKHESVVFVYVKKASHMAYFFYAWVSYFINKLSVSETDSL